MILFLFIKVYMNTSGDEEVKLSFGRVTTRPPHQAIRLGHIGYLLCIWTTPAYTGSFRECILDFLVRHIYPTLLTLLVSGVSSVTLANNRVDMKASIRSPMPNVAETN